MECVQHCQFAGRAEIKYGARLECWISTTVSYSVDDTLGVPNQANGARSIQATGERVENGKFSSRIKFEDRACVSAAAPGNRNSIEVSRGISDQLSRSITFRWSVQLVQGCVFAVFGYLEDHP